MERFAGTSRASYSYAYYKIFTQADDRHGQGRMKVKSGMVLKWCQYNYQQEAISVDAIFTDGTTLRDNVNIKDQNGVRIHPALHRYPTGRWHCFNVDLSPVAGKEVRHWMIGYDNAVTKWVGQFRAYFDSFYVVWPGGPKQ